MTEEEYAAIDDKDKFINIIIFNVYMFGLYLVLAYSFNEIFQRPNENARRCHVYSVYLFFTFACLGAAIGAGMFLGTYHRYGLVVVIWLICVAISFKKSRFTRLVAAMTF